MGRPQRRLPQSRAGWSDFSRVACGWFVGATLLPAKLRIDRFPRASRRLSESGPFGWPKAHTNAQLAMGFQGSPNNSIPRGGIRGRPNQNHGFIGLELSARRKALLTPRERTPYVLRRPAPRRYKAPNLQFPRAALGAALPPAVFSCVRSWPSSTRLRPPPECAVLSKRWRRGSFGVATGEERERDRRPKTPMKPVLKTNCYNVFWGFFTSFAVGQ